MPSRTGKVNRNSSSSARVESSFFSVIRVLLSVSSKNYLTLKGSLVVIKCQRGD